MKRTGEPAPLESTRQDVPIRRKDRDSERHAGAEERQGIAFMMASAFLFGLLGLFIKLLGPSFRVWDIAAFRFGGGLLLLLLIFGRRENLFRPANPRLMLIRGLTGTAAFLSLVSAIQLVSLSTAMVLFYSYPAFAALIAPILFRDRIAAVDVFWIAVALAGVAVLFDAGMHGSLTGRMLGVSAALFAGLTVTLIRRLRETHSSAIIYFHFCLMGGIITAVPFLADPRLPRTAAEWLLVLGIVVTSVSAQLLMNQGFRYCNSWKGGMYMTSEVVHTTLFGVIFLGEGVTWRFWVGGFLIVGSALFSHLRTQRPRLPRR
ncbi:MAG: DMT family transporter [Desulfobacteraceae bacterium]|jgi:drug/metabolite transporter (DMT)-like permease|nr:DMT family transporter [Desulfobacteraceae bacterium]